VLSKKFSSVLLQGYQK